jgi:hypothetical protein
LSCIKATCLFADKRVTDLYGVRPSVSFVEVAELVDNG